MKWLFLIMAISMVCCGNAATTWYVTKSGKDTNSGKSESAAFLTIQKAIDSAADEDRIIVSDGTYDPISSGNKKVCIESKNGAEKTIINGAGKNRCATLGSAVTHRDTTLKGFTLQNGYVVSSLGGGGAFGGTLINCLIKNCWSDESGNGGGVRGGWLYQCIITGCGLKHDASNTDTYIKGGGASDARLINCVVANNDATSNYHLSVSGTYNCQLENTIVADNKGRDATQISSCNAVNSCVPGENANAGGNVCVNCVMLSPMFVDSKNANYQLLIGSPCVDAGDNGFIDETKDYAGNPRVVGAAIDIGAYEWYEGSSSISIDVEGAGSFGTTWYVTKSGKDTNTGKSESTAFLTIQKAIDTAAAGDRIIVSDGTYDPISSGDKKVRIESKNGVSKTSISGNGKNRCATLGSMVTHRDTTLKGFTLQNGYVVSSLGGGGAFGGTLINCLIKNCWSDESGNGGGVRGGWLYQCIITGCGLKHDASNTDTYIKGGGASDARLINCVVANNDATSNYHLSVSGTYNCQLENTIVADNKGRDATQVSSCSVVNCCLPASDINVNGNSCAECVSGYPMFLDAKNANYRLLAGSPCIDQGASVYTLGRKDYTGNPRVVGVVIDIGAYEWYEGSSSISIDVDGVGSYGTTWYVTKSGKDTNTGKSESAAFLTIQKAIDTAAAGDRIIVSDGTYDPISSGNKKVRIESKNGVSKTSISGNSKNRCATLGSAVTHRNTVLKGFTLQNGYVVSSLGGGGAFGGTLINCLIKNCWSDEYGNGGGVRGGWLYQCIITGCGLKHDASNTDTYIKGGGASDARLINCVVANNDATSNYHLSVSGTYNCQLENTIVADNKGRDATQVSSCSVVNCCLPASDINVNGNSCAECVSGYPMFLDAKNANYRLLAGSPCIDQGASVYTLGRKDYTGNPRVVGVVIDIGAYEWYEGSSSISIDVDGVGSYGTTWYVTKSGKDTNTGKSESAAFLTIQKAIDTAAAGDRIIVSDGTYDPISSGNKKVRIESKNGVSKTSISGNSKNRCATLGSAVTHRNTVLKGFTLQNGYVVSSLGGGGAFGGTLINCLIKNCWSDEYGNGGGVRGGWLYQCIITGCGLKHDASNTDTYIKGGGASDARLINCVVANNDATSNYHLSVSGTYNCQLENTIVADNKGRDATQVSYCGAANSCVPGVNVTSSGNMCGNCVTASPMFVDSKNANYRLLKGSPCVDAGAAVYALSTTDYFGGMRVRNGAIDIGAFELQSGLADVKNVEAKPRYPWNGKVDVLFAISGDAGVRYDVSLSAKDLVGNTNLTIKTIYRSDGTAANAAKEQLTPGTYNWVWNAAADLGVNAVLDRVVVEVKAE